MELDAVKYISLIATYIGFVILYLWAIRLESYQRWKPLIAIVAITFIVTSITPGSSSIFPYVGFLIGFSYGTRTYLILLASIISGIIILYLYYQYPIFYFLLPAISGVVALSLWGQIERIHSSARMRCVQSREEIQQLAIIAERERIARDLHDILGHTLSSIALKGELAEKLLQQNKTQEVQQHLFDLHNVARESLKLVRETVSGYKRRGLSGEVIQLCNKLRQNGFSINLYGEIPTVTARAESAIILALTELTTNILRHSNGNHCQLSFSVQNNNIVISLQDNGCISVIKPGNGLNGIQERLYELAGNVNAHILNGCRFDITLPAQELIQTI